MSSLLKSHVLLNPNRLHWRVLHQPQGEQDPPPGSTYKKQSLKERLEPLGKLDEEELKICLLQPGLKRALDTQVLQRKKTKNIPFSHLQNEAARQKDLLDPCNSEAGSETVSQSLPRWCHAPAALSLYPSSQQTESYSTLAIRSRIISDSQVLLTPQWQELPSSLYQARTVPSKCWNFRISRC